MLLIRPYLICVSLVTTTDGCSCVTLLLFFFLNKKTLFVVFFVAPLCYNTNEKLHPICYFFSSLRSQGFNIRSSLKTYFSKDTFQDEISLM